MEDFMPSPQKPSAYANLLILFWFLALGGSVAFRRLDDPAYRTRLDHWHQQRIAELKKESGWLNLAGLYWLKEGVNTVGGSGNDLVFVPEKVTGRLGTFQLSAGTVRFTPAPTARVSVAGKAVQEPVVAFTDGQTKPVVLEHGALRWFVIKRGDRYGIRLRDLESAQLRAFHGVDRFPADESWQIRAKVERPSQPRTIPITDVLGLTHQQPLAGTLVFDLKGTLVRLDAVGEGDKLFVLFADPTNGQETYGSGRFLYVDKPDASGKTVLDFNQAINPPCAFTPYATCPLPPRQNRLALRVTAGEKKPDDHFHH